MRIKNGAEVAIFDSVAWKKAFRTAVRRPERQSPSDVRMQIQGISAVSG